MVETLRIEDDYSVEFVYEWFGKSARYYQKDGKTYADVKVNEQALIYWCLQYGGTIELIEPIETREKLKQKLELIKNKYSPK